VCLCIEEFFIQYVFYVCVCSVSCFLFLRFCFFIIVAIFTFISPDEASPDWMTKLDQPPEFIGRCPCTNSSLFQTSYTHLSRPNIKSPLHHIRWRWELKLLTDGARTTEFSKLFHQLITLSENKCSRRFVLLHVFFNFQS